MRKILSAFLVILPAAASAQTAERFQLEKTDEGYVRMDTQTGAMSVCTMEAGDQLVCRMAADDREALEDETERLRGELERLDARVSALEARPAVALPSEQDIDKTLGVMEHLFRGFAGIVREWQDEAPDGKSRIDPNRT